MVSFQRQIGCPDLDEHYEDMPELHQSDSEERSATAGADTDEDEEGNGILGSLKPALSARVVNPILLRVL